MNAVLYFEYNYELCLKFFYFDVVLNLGKIFYLFHWWTTASEDATTPIVLLPIAFIGGEGTALLDKKKTNAPTPSKTRTEGITIAHIPPVDNPPDFFLYSTFSRFTKTNH